MAVRLAPPPLPSAPSPPCAFLAPFFLSSGVASRLPHPPPRTHAATPFRTPHPTLSLPPSFRAVSAGPNVGPSLGPGVPNLAAVERLCALTGVDKVICAQALRDCQGDVRAAAELLLTADPSNRGVAHTALPAAGPKAGPQPGVQDVGAALRAQDQAARLALQQEAVAQLPRAGGLSEEQLWAVPSALLPAAQDDGLGGVQAAGGLLLDAKSCCLCMDAPKTHIVLPCGHKCLCASCAAGFNEGGGRFCPLCRSPMDRVMAVLE